MNQLIKLGLAAAVTLLAGCVESTGGTRPSAGAIRSQSSA